MISAGRISAKRVFGVAVAAVVSVGLMAYLILQVDWSVYTERLSAPSTGAALAATAAIYVCTLLLRGVRFRFLFQRLVGENHTYPRILDLVFLNNLLNHIFPLRAGEVAFVALSKRRYAISLSEATAVLLVARIGDLTGLLVGLAISSLFISVSVPVRSVTAFCALIGVLLLWRLDLLIAGLSRILSVLEGFLPAVFQKRGAGLVTKLDGLRTRIRDGDIALKNLAFSISIWIVNTLFFFAVLRVLGIPIDFAQTFFGGSGAAILPSLPVNMLGSLGALEAGWTAGLVFVGIDQSEAIASGVIMHGVVIIVSACISIPAIFRVIMVRKNEKPPSEKA